ncbi:MAG: zinc ABC transporter substrate-binding protein [Ruminococcaceae bacterium]|nr:zinc ABC transporter substrate-binding protein [Oscillospiraceae bacterium]
MKRIICLMLSLVLLSGCGVAKKRNNNGFLVYTSFYAMHDFVKMIAGDKAEVVNLIPPGVHIHDWEPGPKDMAGLEQADLFVYCNDDMERWVDSVEDALENRGVATLEATDEIEEIEISGVDDPHVWLNPRYAYRQMAEICEELCELDRVNASFYRGNLKNCAGRIDLLDEKFRQTVKGFSGRDVVVTHGAYGYLCKAYGLNQIVLEGILSSGDPSPAKMAEVIKTIREKQIRCVFYDAMGSDSVARAIASECGIKALPLYSFEGDTEGRDYFAVMEENLNMLQKGLGGTDE